MISAAHDIAKWLGAQGVGTFGGSSGWSIAANIEPLSPAQCITVYDTSGGQGPDTDEQDILQPTFQVRVRAPKQVDCAAKLDAIRTLLVVSNERITTADSRFISIRALGDLMSLGQTDNNNMIMVCEFMAIRMAL